jgi:hypothetical protein
MLITTSSQILLYSYILIIIYWTMEVVEETYVDGGAFGGGFGGGVFGDPYGGGYGTT